MPGIVIHSLVCLDGKQVLALRSKIDLKENNLVERYVESSELSISR